MPMKIEEAISKLRAAYPTEPLCIQCEVWVYNPTRPPEPDFVVWNGSTHFHGSTLQQAVAEAAAHTVAHQPVAGEPDQFMAEAERIAVATKPTQAATRRAPVRDDREAEFSFTRPRRESVAG
jgi:hypothetical protein